MKKIILAYSGGLDTSCCIPWLKNKGYEVICFSVNLGSEFSPSDLKKRAQKSGASKIYVKDARNEFADDFILPALKAGAVYENKYLLSTALGRPLIAKYLAEVAKKEKAKYIAHGCTGKGNDQVRIEVALKSLLSHVNIVAPLREWSLSSREAEINYARKNSIPVSASKKKPYSIDKNIWGISVESGILEKLDKDPPKNSFVLTRELEKAPNKAESVEIEFNKAKPVKLNGKKLKLVSLIERLNKKGGKHAIGRTDLIEDRTVGIKSREIYEAPAAWILHTALRELENLILDKETLQFKETVSLKYAQLAYQGLWFCPLKEALDGFVESVQEKLSGKVVLKLYKGNITVVKRSSKNSRYREEMATYTGKDKFNREWAEGFINIWSLPFCQK